MLTRRNALALAATSLLARGESFAAASQPSTPVDFEVPADACDCHTHIFGDPSRFPLFAGRTYTPEPASAEEMTALHRALHVKRVVIVTPSIYGTDNSSTLYGMKVRGATARGIAVIDEKTSEAELNAMENAGVRGIRLSMGPASIATGRERFQWAANRMKSREWHIQIYGTLPMFSGLKDLILTSPVPVVIDHVGGAKPAAGVEQPGFADLLALVESGKAYVKISHAFQFTAQLPDAADAAPLAQAVIRANPDRVLWGTDWPHPDPLPHPGRLATDLAPLNKIDDGLFFNRFARWVSNPALRKTILADNPARLYRF